MVESLLNYDEIINHAMSFDGWFAKVEADSFIDIITVLKDNGAIVEIGSWCGRSLGVITATAMQTGLKSKIYSIDPFVTSKDEPNGKYDTFVSNLKLLGLFDRVEHIKEKSQIAGLTFDEDIEFLFIDGMHKYDFVKKDFELFYPKVVNNGYIAFHDVTNFYGPACVVRDILKNYAGMRFVKKVGVTAIFQKVSQLTDEDKWVNQNALISFENLIKYGKSLIR